MAQQTVRSELAPARPPAMVLAHFRDTLGNEQVTGDYSTTPTQFHYNPAKQIAVYTLNCQLATVKLPKPEQYGDLPALTNGIIVVPHDVNNVPLRTPDVSPIMSNMDWHMLAHEFHYWQTGKGLFVYKASFRMDVAGGPLLLDGRIGEHYDVLLNDDFTGLASHRFTIEGREIT